VGIILSLPVGSFCHINVAYPADRNSHGGVEATSDKQYFTEFYIFLTVHLRKILVGNQLDAQAYRTATNTQ
jgi:hypothetical protein